MAFVIQQFVIPHRTLKLGADFRVRLSVKPFDAANTNQQHAPHRNSTVLQLFVQLAVNAARQQSIRAPGQNHDQERECYCLLEREPGTQPAWKH
jgi:hypothetical protein